jgi:hypothetical protein
MGYVSGNRDESAIPRADLIDRARPRAHVDAGQWAHGLRRHNRRSWPPARLGTLWSLTPRVVESSRWLRRKGPGPSGRGPPTCLGGTPMRPLGCDQRAILQKFSSPQDQSVAKQYISDLRAGKFDVIENDLAANLRTPQTHATLVRMAAMLPAGAPTSATLIGAQTLYTPDGVRTNTTFEYRWGGRWFVCNVAILKSKTHTTIVGFNVDPEKSSIEDQTRFTLTGKSALQYAILTGAIAAFTVSVYALVACIRARGLARKWLWIIFVIVGFGRLSINWTTGAVGFQLLYINLFSAGAFAPLYGPWTIAMAAPVGALVFLWRRWRGELTRAAAGPRE